MQEIQAHGLVYGISDRAVVDALLKSRVARDNDDARTTSAIHDFRMGEVYHGRDLLPKFGNASPPNSLRRDPPRFREYFRFRDF